MDVERTASGGAAAADTAIRWRYAWVVAGVGYVVAQGWALTFTQSGDWGIGWRRLDLRDLFMPALCCLLPSVAAALAFVPSRMKTSWIGLLQRHWWRLALAFAVMLAVATLPAPAWRRYVVAVTLTAIFLAAAWLLLWTAAASVATATARRVAAAVTRPGPRFVWLLSAWTLAIAAALSWYAFERVPHVPDEVAYLFQAKYFAAGRLFVPPPPDAGAFELPHTLVAGDRWFSIFPPAWPAALALGVAAGVPWLVNPLLGAFSILLLHRLVSDLYSETTANLAGVLLAASPMFLLMSAGMMSHPLSLVCMLLAVHGWNRSTLDGRRAGLLGGIALGVLVLTRPIEGVTIGAVLAAWSIARFPIATGSPPVRRAVREQLPAMAIFAAAAVAVACVMLPYNRLLTGRALLDPITKYFDELYYPGANRLGFGADVGNLGWQNDLRPGHTPAEAVLNSRSNAYLLNLEMTGWATGSLAAIVGFLLFGRWSRADALFASLAAAIVFALALYWYSGADYGARYWYQTLVPGVVLTARGIQAATDGLRSHMRSEQWTGRVAIATAIACACAVLLVVPWRAVTKYRHYRDMSAEVRRLTAARDLSGALVFVRDTAHAKAFPRYTSAAILNGPVVQESSPVFARELDAASGRRVECAFTGRPLVVIDVSLLPDGPARFVDAPSAVATCDSALPGDGR